MASVEHTSDDAVVRRQRSEELGAVVAVVGEAAFQVAVLPDFEPSMTGGFIYTDVFWQLDCVGLRTSDR